MKINVKKMQNVVCYHIAQHFKAILGLDRSQVASSKSSCGAKVQSGHTNFTIRFVAKLNKLRGLSIL